MCTLIAKESIDKESDKYKLAACVTSMWMSYLWADVLANRNNNK